MSMWTHLEPPSAKLEQVFKPMFAKAMQFDRVWSIADLRLSDDDVKWLRSWFGCLTQESTYSYIYSFLPANFELDAAITYRQMFGSLLICAGAEICREEGREDSVWPVIRGLLPEPVAIHNELFLSNGQPSSLMRYIIADAVRVLNLRHAMDIEGTQQWFVTFKLQFGFTYRGAKNRLAEWLVNLGQPHAIQYLRGETEFSDLASDSFQSMWRALTQFRRGLILEAEVRNTLEQNPWVKAHWIDNLLKEAKAKIATLGIGDWHPEETLEFDKELSVENLCPIEGVALEWPQGTMPRLRFQIDREKIESEVNDTQVGELDFYIDGRRLTRWLRQRDGSWAGMDCIYAEPDKYKNKPNLRPGTLTVLSGSGEPLVEWDFTDSGLSEEVLLFDLEREKIVSAGTERLDLNRRYAIVCDRNCNLQGCDSIEVFERIEVSRKTIRLASPLKQNLCISYQDFVLWQPVQAEGDQRPQFSLTLTTPEGEIKLQARTKLIIKGLPDDTESVALLIHTKTIPMHLEKGEWSTSKEVTITPELAARQRRVRIRFTSGGRTTTIEPRLEFNLFGVAVLRSDAESISYVVLNRDDKLNRSEGTAYLRIWTPDNDPRALVYEGGCQVGRLRYNKIRLRDLPGHGGELRVKNQRNEFPFGVICTDTGCVRKFLPSILGCDAQLSLLSDKNASDANRDGYGIYFWLVDEIGRTKFNQLSDSDIQPNSSERTWFIRNSNNPIAVALTWKGHWLGAWWDIQRICEFIKIKRFELTDLEFQLVKWFRVPILHPKLEDFAEIVYRQPSKFIREWTCDERLPGGVKPHGDIGDVFGVIREYLWIGFPAEKAGGAISVVEQLHGSSHELDCCIKNLQTYSEISPILLWKGMEHYLSQSTGRILALLKAFTRQQLGLPSNASRIQLDSRLERFEGRIENATKLMKSRIADITINWITRMREQRSLPPDEQDWGPLDDDIDDLFDLGDILSGRNYIAARIGMYWLKLAGVE